jgi:predicted HAD superfamily hydrolase
MTHIIFYHLISHKVFLVKIANKCYIAYEMEIYVPTINYKCNFFYRSRKTSVEVRRNRRKSTRNVKIKVFSFSVGDEVLRKNN